MKNRRISSRCGGMSIVFAVLLISIVLAVSLTLFNITFRQLILSAVGRDSRYAFYASDSARNCAVYWDRLDDVSQRPFGYFKDVPPYKFIRPLTKETDIACDGRAGKAINNEIDSPTPGVPFVADFTVFFSQPGSSVVPCAQVKVTKYNDSDRPFLPRTKIRSSGYNLSASPNCPSVPVGERTVERVSSKDISGP